MATVKSRREEYSDATRAGLLDSALQLFAERGYARTSLDDIASATRVTKGALYHHFDGKQALFEAVLDRLEIGMQERVTRAASGAGDAWAATQAGLDAFLTLCCEPAYARIVMQEGPVALGWERWRECEEKYAYGLVQTFLRALIDAGAIAAVPLESATRITFGMLSAAALALAEAPDDEKPRVKDEVAGLLRGFLLGLRA
ncbi:MAG: TetR/AcrR family transcriptional regulator [Carbonactinosporaceae bacterium]